MRWPNSPTSAAWGLPIPLLDDVAAPSGRSNRPGIGPILQRLREEKEWSREALAYHSGMSFAAIEQLETGRRQDPRLSTLIALARALGCRLDDLVPRDCPED
jgi:DNA-binding Xre family transcriptional regulator